MIESSDKIMRGKNSLLSRDVQKAQNVKFEKEKKKEISKERANTKMQIRNPTLLCWNLCKQ
jgi:hypothetical protein